MERGSLEDQRADEASVARVAEQALKGTLEFAQFDRQRTLMVGSDLACSDSWIGNWRRPLHRMAVVIQWKLTSFLTQMWFPTHFVSGSHTREYLAPSSHFALRHFASHYSLGGARHARSDGLVTAMGRFTGNKRRLSGRSFSVDACGGRTS